MNRGGAKRRTLTLDEATWRLVRRAVDRDIALLRRQLAVMEAIRWGELTLAERAILPTQFRMSRRDLLLSLIPQYLGMLEDLLYARKRM